jgi:hypothetical protein
VTERRGKSRGAAAALRRHTRLAEAALRKKAWRAAYGSFALSWLAVMGMRYSERQTLTGVVRYPAITYLVMLVPPIGAWLAVYALQYVRAARDATGVQPPDKPTLYMAVVGLAFCCIAFAATIVNWHGQQGEALPDTLLLETGAVEGRR